MLVDDLLCGHLPGECWGNTVECAYWRAVALGELPPPAGLPGPIEQAATR